MGNGVFVDCHRIKDITIPHSVKTIGDYTFQSCECLESVTILNGVKSIGKESFWFCNNLKSITLPTSIKAIGKNTFSFCDNMENITMTMIGDLCTYTIKGLKIKDFISSIFSEENSNLTVTETPHVSHMNIPAIVYFALESDNKVAKKYVMSNMIKVIKYCTEVNDIKMLVNLLDLGYVTKDTIDDLIKFSIDSNNAEIQIILTNYKNDNIGFGNKTETFLTDFFL